MRKSFVDTLVTYARRHKNVMLLTGDLGAGALEPFEKAFGARYINCGIAEQNMIAVAAGLAMAGKEVVIYSIGDFDTLRVIEFVRNLVCYNKANVKIVSVGAGLEYGALGFTHHTTEDIACMRSLPNMQIFSPATARECEASTLKMLESDGPCYLRLAKKGVNSSIDVPVLAAKSRGATQKIDVNSRCYANGLNYVFGGKKALILSTGAILKEAIIAKFQAEELLKTNGVVAVYSVSQLKPIADDLATLLSKYDYVYTIEEHTVMGGLGSIVAEVIAQNALGTKLKMIGINDEIAKTVGSHDYLISGENGCYNINAGAIVRDIATNVK